MKKNLIQCIMPRTRSKSKVQYNRTSYILRKLAFHLLPRWRVHGRPEWRVLLLFGTQISPGAYRRAGHIATLEFIKELTDKRYPVRVIHSQLESRFPVVGYLELWDKGKLASRTELQVTRRPDLDAHHPFHLMGCHELTTFS